MKKVGSFCVASILILLIFFHLEVITLLTEWGLRSYTTSKWGKPLEYKTVYWASNGLVIVDPHFENHAAFSAEQMILDFHVDWLKWTLYVNIDFENPHWHLSSPISSQKNRWKKFFNQGIKWLKIVPTFVVRSGLLTCMSDSDDTSSPCHLHFDLEGNLQLGGTLTLNFDSQNPAYNALVFKASSFPTGMEVNCCCQKVNCHSLFTLGRFFGIKFPSLVIKSGTLEGQVKAFFPTSQRPYVEGEFAIEGINFYHPESHLEGNVEHAKLTLEKNQIAYEVSDLLPTFIGQFTLQKPASLVYDFSGHEWAIPQIVGSIKLDHRETISVDLDALGGHLDDPSHFLIRGEANLSAHRFFGVNLSMQCSSNRNAAEGQINFTYFQPRKGEKHAELELKKVSYHECDFLQTLLSTYWPVFNEIKLENGELDALVESNVNEQGVGQLEFKQFQAVQLCSKVKSWNAKCCGSHISGYGKVKLGCKDFWDTLDANLQLKDGEIHFEDIHPRLPLTNIQAQLLVQQGHVDHSLITLQLANMKGIMDVEWGNRKQLLTIKLEGVVQDLAELLPEFLQDGIKANFNQNRLMILANIKKQNQLECGGTIHIQGENSDQMDLIHFGTEWKKMNCDVNASFVPIGWFYGQHLSLQKYLSPFIFPNGKIQLTGEAEFKGSFDNQTLSIKYDAENLKLENEDFCINVKNLHSNIPGSLNGSHEINLKNYSHQGTLPISQASYVEKKSGLVFQEIQGVANFENRLLRIAPLEAYCEGIYFAGDLQLDYRDPRPGVFKLLIQCPTVFGKISYVQNLLSHLNQSSVLHQIPLEGEIAAKNQGLKMDFAFCSKGFGLQINLQGTITEGFMSMASADLALKGIYMDFDYNHQNQLLACSDIQGALLVGKPHRVEEYLFIGDHICVYNPSDPDIELDIAIRNRENELLRIVGCTKEIASGIKQFLLDKNLSHLGCIYPHIWRCSVKNWTRLEDFEFRSQFDLNGFLSFLKCFRHTGLYCLSYSLIEKLCQQYPVEGQGVIALQHQPDVCTTYQFTASHIKSQSNLEHKIFLQGRKVDQKWFVDQFQWDDLNLSAELQHMVGAWKIHFLGLHIGDSLLVGLNGSFNSATGLLQAQLKFCELNLSKFEHYASLHPFFAKWRPSGLVKATGQFEWDSSLGWWEGLSTNLSVEVNHFALNDYPINHKKLGQLKGTFTLENHHAEKLLRLELEDGLYNCKNYSFDLKKFQLKIQSDELRLSAFSHYEQQPFQMTMTCQWPSCGRGSCIITNGQDVPVVDPLLVHWENHSTRGFLIHSMKGEFAGCTFNLEADQNQLVKDEKKTLAGQVTVGFPLVNSLLSAHTVQILQKLKIGSCYTLLGQFSLSPNLGNTLLETFSFKGKLASDEAILKGYLFKRLEADVQYVPGRLELQNISIQDRAVSIKGPTLIATLKNNKDEWSLFIPQIQIKNLRFALLRDLESKQCDIHSKLDSLIVKRIDFQNFSGRLDEIETWQAQGNLNFVNPSRKNMFYPLFAIPGEIILRLGLDPHVLNPVTGTVYFNLKGDRFFLTRFKNVYSEGRGSKFYLAQGATPSWMDFNGNLFIQVRMKQYNLIFKIAEPFIVSIHGHILKPRYMLQKS